MACPTGRCALRRFDGHGTGSYRPTNSALAAEGEARLSAMLAERRAVDAMFGGAATEEQLTAVAQRQHLAVTAPVVDRQSPGTDRQVAFGTKMLSLPTAPAQSLPGITPWKTPSASAPVSVDKMRLTHK